MRTHRFGRKITLPATIAVKASDQNADGFCSGGHSISQSQDPLPPYELDPMFDNPFIRNRIGEMIAKAVEKWICKR